MDRTDHTTGRRWERVRAALDASDLDALYVSAGPNYAWLTGGSPYAGGLPVWLSGLVVARGHEPVAVMSAMHADILGPSVGEVVTYEDGDDPVPTLRRTLTAAGVTASARVGVEDRIGFADVRALEAAMPGLALTSAQDVFDALRAIKDADEIALLRRSGAAVDAAYTAAQEALAGGASVADAGVAMTAAMVASGAHRPQIGGSFRDYATAADSNLVDIDIGASFGGYAVDTARSFYVGRPTAEIVAQYEVVRAAYDAAEAVTRAGVPAEAVHAACADVISAAGFTQSWKVGHGVGLADGHEAPLLQPGNATPLEPDMVFTIDPGFFVARNLPLHLEETVRVTETGCERLTSYPLDLVVI
jgi:Xaa-Pro dipeptidase